MKRIKTNLKRRKFLKTGARCLMWIVFLAATVIAQTTEFTYQGKLSDTGGQATAYDFVFRLCASETASCTTPLATSSQNNISVPSSGNFTVKLDFGAASFDGADRFLEIAVRRANTGNFMTLAPRQKLTSAPYAIQALNTESFGNLGVSDFVQDNDPRVQPSNYVQNGTTAQPGVSFNIGGEGTASIFNAGVQFNLNGSRILSNPGTRNLFAGVGAGGSTSTGGSFNAFFGYNAGNANTFASGNAFFGHNAGLLTTTGGSNTFIGSGTGGSNTGGSNNTAIGGNAGLAGSSQTNSTAVGAGAFVTQSNSLVLGSINGVNGATADTRVGIGTTAPAFKLQIVDALNTGLRVQTNTAGGTIASFGSTGAFQVDATNVAGGRFNLLENGNVGIGNNAPVYKLDVVGSANEGLRVRNTNAGGTVASFGGNGAFRVDSSGVTGGRLSILENGNVGIGNASPTAKLEVTGNGTSSTALEINNGAIKVTGAGINTFTPVSVIERGDNNSCGDGNLLTVIDNPYSNNDPNAILLVTTVLPSFTPVNTTPATLYYALNDNNCPQFNNKWVIKLAYGGNALPVRFNVMIIKR